MKRTFVALVLIVLAAAGWFFISPLFIDRAIDEPLTVSDVVPTRAEVEAMTESQRDALMSELMTAAKSAPDQTMDEPMDMTTAPTLSATGRFSDADLIHKGSGRALLYALPDGGHLVRFEDFRVTNGPALVVLLAEAADPQSAADVQAGYVEIGKLKGNVGNQNYPIPPAININEYRSIVVWCALFDVLFSAAPLSESRS